MSSVSRQRRRPKQKQYRKKRIPTRIDSDSVSQELNIQNPNFYFRLRIIHRQ